MLVPQVELFNIPLLPMQERDTVEVVAKVFINFDFLSLGADIHFFQELFERGAE